MRILDFHVHYNGNASLAPPHDARLALPLDEDGCLPVPDGPGLGVELDEDKYRKCRVAPD